MRPKRTWVHAFVGVLALLSRTTAIYLRANGTVLKDSQGLVSSGADSAAPYSPANPFLFWTDYPGSPQYNQLKPQWYDPILTAAGDSFETDNGITVNVNWADQSALHLWADPGFQQSFDDVIRKTHGAQASVWTGTIDSCGWPFETPEDAPQNLQYSKRTTPFYEDFSTGLHNTSFFIPTGYKGCCASDLADNFAITTDVVNGVKKNVLAMTALNRDNGCGAASDGLNAPTSCSKVVSSAGGLITADIFASGVYTVIAKVPQAPGLIWAVWTYHYELHMPQNCASYSCFCGDWGTQGCPDNECMPQKMFEEDACPATGGCPYLNFCKDPGYSGSVQQQCARNHSVEDPQFYGSASFTDYIQQTNHEIDIEIPANCMNTPNVCNDPTGSCMNDYSTVNFNNYIMTNNAGGGPSYTNMCARVTKADGSPMQLLGDGNYHNYTIEWHTGTSASGGPSTSAYVNFFIDGVYMGTNNAFVPTRAGRLWISLWPSSGTWNGYPNTWGGGHPGDGKVYTQTTYISSVSITPFNEPNDIAYPMTIDQPNGCQEYVGQKQCHKWTSYEISV